MLQADIAGAHQRCPPSRTNPTFHGLYNNYSDEDNDEVNNDGDHDNDNDGGDDNYNSIEDNDNDGNIVSDDYKYSDNYNDDYDGDNDNDKDDTPAVNLTRKHGSSIRIRRKQWPGEGRS